MDPAGTPVQVGVAELALLEQLQQVSLVDVQIHRFEPCPQQRSSVFRPQIGAHVAVADVPLAHDALHDLQDRTGAGRRGTRATAERSDRKRHGCVGPLRCAALDAMGRGATGADVGQESLGRRRMRGLGERPTDIDSGVVIGPPDGGATMGLDVDERRQVELLRTRAVARLPDREQLGEPAAVASRERCLYRVERMRERRGELARVEILGARFNVVVVGLQPFVVVRRDSVTEHVDRLWLVLEPDRELLGNERIREMVDGLRARDCVVVCDRHEAHPAPLGQLVDLVGRRGALGEVKRALDAEL